MLKKLRQNQGLVFALFLLLVASYLIYQIGRKIEAEQIRDLVAQFGIAGPIVYMTLVVLSVVIAPIQGVPIWIGGFFAFGIPLVVIYSWVAGNIGGALAFLIAKRWGRPVVKRLVGTNLMEKIDEIVKDIGFVTLLILRIFQSNLFDSISYAAGLTNLSFKAFMLATVVGTALPAILFILFYDSLTKQGWSILGIVATWGILGWILTSIPAIWYFLKRRIGATQRLVDR